MKSNSDNIPSPVFQTASEIQLNFAVEQTETGYSHETVFVQQLDRDKIISAIIRDKYSVDAEFAIANNYADGIKIEEFCEFQKQRSLAKWLADQLLNGDLVTREQYDAQYLLLQYIKVTMPVSLLLTGGRYETLANDMLKKKVPWQLKENDVAEAYLGYILPEHLEILQADPEVTIEMY